MKQPWKTRLFPLLFKFVQTGVDRVEIGFSGSGDEGSIHSYTYFKEVEDGQFEPLKDPITPEEEGILEAVMYDYLENLGYDWYNNDGGDGQIIIDVKLRHLACHTRLAYTAYESYEDEVELVTESPDKDDELAA